MTELTKELRRRCSDDIALDKLRKAVEITKGLCNNYDALDIARRADSTVEDIVRLGAYEVVPSTPAEKPLLGADKVDKKKRGAKPEGGGKVKDSFVYRYITDRHLNIERCYIGTCREIPLNSMTVRTHHNGYFNGHVKNMLYLADHLDDELKQDGKVVKALSETDAQPDELHDMYGDDKNIIATRGNEFRARMQAQVNARYSFYKWEVDALNHAPAQVKSDILTEGRVYQTLTQAAFNSNNGIMYIDNHEASMRLEKTMSAKDNLQFMGLGVYYASNFLTGPSNLRKGLQPLYSQIAKCKSQYIRMMKKGYDPHSIRQEIVNDLNMSASVRCFCSWVFFERTDAPTTDVDSKITRPITITSASGTAFTIGQGAEGGAK